jgi:hypothetical protein
MAKQIIDIGVQGNDGTGDSIRDSFRKVNENFNEIYSIFGQGRITLSQLNDGTEYTQNQLIMGNDSGNKLIARDLEPGTNISIDIKDYTDPITRVETHSVTISSSAAKVSDDINPEIKYPFNVNFKPIGRVADPSQAVVDAFNLKWDTQTTFDQLPVTVGYANKTYLGVYNGVIGYKNESGQVVPPSLSINTSQVDTTSEYYDPTLTGNYLTTSIVPRKDVVYRGGDTMSGPLYLNDHPKDLAGFVGNNAKADLQAATAYYVDNKTFSSNVNLYVATSGDDLQTQTPAGKEGRFWNYAFKSIGSALLHAESLISIASQEPGPYKQRISYTVGPDQSFSTIQKVALTSGKTTDAGYVAAFNYLQANREFIQAETVAYINKRYVNPFAYNHVTLAAKVNSLLTSVSNDIVLGATSPNSSTAATNYNSYWEGVSYNYDNPTSEGLIQWLDTVNFVKDQIINFSYSPAALETYTGQIIDALAYDLLFLSNYQSIQASIAFKDEGTNISPSQLSDMLTVKPITITSAECVGSYVTLHFNPTATIVFPVDSEILINAAFIGKKPTTIPVTLLPYSNFLIQSFTVKLSTTSSVSFLKGTTDFITDDYTVTGTFDRKNVINMLVLNPTISDADTYKASLISNAKLIATYVTTGALPEVVFPTPAVPNVLYDVTGHVSAKKLILENITFIQSETIAYLSSKFPNIIYDRKLAVRDVKYILWSLVYDVMYGGNSQSVYAGNSFWSGAATYFTTASVKIAVIAAVRRINELVQSIILNDTLEVTYQQSVRQYKNDTLSNGIVASTSLSTNITLIADIMTSLANVPSSIDTPDITSAELDVQTAFTSIIDDKLVYTTNPESSTSWFMDHFYPVINDTINQDKITNLFAKITDIIESGQHPLDANATDFPTYPTLTDVITKAVTGNVTLTAALINAAITSIETNIQDIITDSGNAITGITNAQKLQYESELRNVIVAVCYDIKFGGTTASVRAAGKLTQIGTKLNTQAIIQQSLDFMLTYIVNAQVADLITLKFNAVSGQFNTVKTTATPVNLALYSSAMYVEPLALRDLITNEVNAATIVNDTISYVDVAYAGGFEYDESLCFRDVGSVVDAMSIDIITGGTWQSITVGKSFYKNSSARTIAVGGTHYTQSLAGLQYALKVGQQVLDGVSAVRFQSIPQVFTLTSFASSSIGVAYNNESVDPLARAKFVTGMNAVIDILQYGVGYAQTPVYGTGLWHVIVNNGGRGYVDQGAPLNNDIFPAKVVVGVGKSSINLSASEAYGSIVKYEANQDTSLMIISINSISQFTLSYKNATTGTIVFTVPGVNTVVLGVSTSTVFTGSVTAGFYTVTLTSGDTSSLTIGQTPIKSSGTGAFGVTLITNVDTIQVRLTKPGFFVLGEELEFGETVKDLNITLFVESGIYYEDLPLRLSANMSIKGDEFRRTLIRPKDRVSQSPWCNIFFYRDAIIDALEIGLIDYNGINYAPAGISASIDGVTNKIVITLSNTYQSLLSWVGKVFTDMNVGKGTASAYTTTTTNLSVTIDHATINAGTGTTTGSVSSTYLTGTIAVNDYVWGTGIPNGSIITAVNMAVNPRTFTITFPNATDATSAITTTLKFIKQVDGNKKRGKAVVDSVSGNTFNCTVIYPFDTAGTYAPTTWRLFGTLNYGRHYLTNPLDPNSAPKNNKEIDVFLCNEGTRILGLTFQSQGGFAMVLDPEGNIKTKSPYIQECASFSQSNNYKRFAGGQFIDGFAGRLYGNITGVADFGITLTVVGETNSGLDVRPPQPPCSFYVRGKRYQIDDVVDFNASTCTVILTLDKSTPYLYTTTGVLTFDSDKSKRDAGYVLDAITSDVALGTTYRTIHAGRRFLTVYSSRITSDLQDLTIAGLNYLLGSANSYVSSSTYDSARAAYSANLSIITGMISNGITATPASGIVWSATGVNNTGDDVLARKIIQNNKTFINTELSAYLESSTLFSLSDYPKYNVLTSQRDIGYVVDAITYDMFYGGDSQTKDSVESFYFNGTSYIPGEGALCQASYTRLKEILPYIIAGTTSPVSPGNSATQILTVATMLTSSISGTTLTVGSVTGTISVGMYVTGGSIPDNTYITGNISGSGAGSTWTVNQTVSATGSITIKGDGAPTAPSGYVTSLNTLCDVVIDYIVDSVYTTPTRSEVRTYPAIPASTAKTAYNVFFTDVVDVVTNQPTKTVTETTIETVVLSFLKNGANLRINLETGGNRSMLANDFAMFNDLAYGIIATNGAFTEQVCTFTYYAHTGLWANNGSNLRGVGCSNTFGNYGMRASGYDVTELPDSANLANHMVQSARVYKQSTVINEMTPTASVPATAVYIIGYDYKPTNGSIIEIDHSVYSGTLSSYTVTSIEYTTIQVNSQPVLKLNLNTSDTGAGSGLAKALYHGQLVSLRSTKSFKFNNIDNVKPTRPSTALQYVDSLNDVYRVIAYNLSESTGDTLGNNIAILQSDNSFSYYTFSTDTKGIATGDPSSDIQSTVAINGGKTTSTTLTVNSVTGILVGHTICGTGWAGQTVQSIAATVTMSTSSISGTTLTVGTVSGTIVVGMYLTGGTIPANTFITANLSGSGAGSTWTVSQTVVQASTTITGIGPVTLSAAPAATPYGTVYFTYKTQGSKVGDTKISVAQVSQLKVIDQVNKGTFVTAYNGRLHLVLKYVTPTFAVSKSYYSYTVGTSTLIVTGTADISSGALITKRNPSTEELEFSGIVNTAIYDGTTYTTITVINPVLYVSQVSYFTAGVVSFGVNATGYLELSSNAIINNAATGISVNALSYVNTVAQVDSVVSKVVTYNIPFSKDNILPKVDSYLTVANNSNSSYNGDHQVVDIVNQTVVTLSSITDFQVGMVVTSQVTIQSVSSVGGISTFTSTASHNMSVGDAVTANITNNINGFIKDTTYYVITTPTATSFTLGTTQGGSSLNLFGISVATGVVIASVTTSANISIFTTNINHGLSNNAAFTPGISTNGFIATTTYYVITSGLAANQFKLSATSGGTALGSFDTTASFLMTVSLKTPQTAIIPGGSAIIQAVSTDALVKTITISPACWIPANAPIRASLAASVASITIQNGGSGYTSAPALTIDGGSFTQQATATCTIVNGSINEVRVIIKGSGYVSDPSVTITPALGNIPSVAAVLKVNLSTAILREATSTAGVSTTQMSLLYVTDPNPLNVTPFGTADALTVSLTSTTVSASAAPSAATYNSVSGFTVAFTATTTLPPAVGAWCKVRLNGTPAYNGAYQVYAATTSTITLFYPGTSPGTSTSTTSTVITLPINGAAVAFTTSTNIVTLNGHGLSNGNVVSFASVTTTSSITANTNYYVINKTTDTFQLSTNGSTVVSLNASGTGVLSVSNNSFSVTYTVVGTLPAVSTWCNVDGNYNPLYNGYGLVTSTTSTPANTVTVLHTLNPGAYTFAGLVSASGSISATITGTGPWTATITNMFSTVGLSVGSTITATSNGGTLFGGTPTSVVVASIVSSSSITYTVTGGTIPTAGSITNIINTSPLAVTVTSTTTSASSSAYGISKPFGTKDSYTFNIGYASNTGAQVTTRISTCRATGHDFCDIGTGGYSTTNIPYSIYGEPALSRQVSNETLDESVGRCFYVSTNQDGIFRVGKFFSVDQGTGIVTLSSKTALSNIEAFGFSGGGAVVNEFSTDATMTDNSSNKVPVESSVRGYVDRRLGLDHGGSPMPFASIIGPGFIPLNGAAAMTGDLPMGSHRITGLSVPTSANDATTKQYVDDLVAGHNELSEMNDVLITSPAVSQLITYTGGVGAKWVNKTLTGNIAITYTVGTGVLSSAIVANAIVDSMVNAAADIAQSKLLLTKSSTRANATSISQADLGVASFHSNQFYSTNGWIELLTSTNVTTGINVNKLQWIAASSILGNLTNSPAAVTLNTPGEVVTAGDGVKNASFTSLGVMTVKTLTTGNVASTYEIVPITTSGGINSMVKTGTQGEINVAQLQIDSVTALDVSPTGTALTKKLLFTTPGVFEFLTAEGTTAANAVTTINGTIDNSGTNGNIKALAVTSIVGTTGSTLNGKWTVPVGSSLVIQGSITSSGGGLTASTDRPIIRPVIMFDFANAKTLDPRITFSRLSTATYFNVAGVLKTAKENQPRFDHDPLTNEPRGLLVEEQRKNLLAWSETFATSGAILPNYNWVDTGITRATSSVLSPDGVNNAIRFTANATDATLSIAGGSVSNTYRTFSVWIRPVATLLGTVSITFDNGTNWNVVTFTDTTRLTRISFSKSTVHTGIIIKLSTATDAVVLWGAQLEEGAFATSYIPTLSTEVIRSADNAEVTGTNFSSWYRKDEGTLIVSHSATGIDISITPKDYGGAVLTNSNLTSVLSVRCSSTGAGPLSALVYDSYGTSASTTQFAFTGYTTSLANSVVTHALAYKANSCSHSYNGTDAEVDSPSTAIIASDIIRLIISNGSGSQTIARIVYYAKRLTDLEHKAITTQ